LTGPDEPVAAGSHVGEGVTAPPNRLSHHPTLPWRRPSHRCPNRPSRQNRLSRPWDHLPWRRIPRCLRYHRIPRRRRCCRRRLHHKHLRERSERYPRATHEACPSCVKRTPASRLRGNPGCIAPARVL